MMGTFKQTVAVSQENECVVAPGKKVKESSVGPWLMLEPGAGTLGC